MYLILTFLALWTGIARAQFDIPTAMMMGMEPQQAMMFMGSGSGTGGGTGGGMDGMGGGGGGMSGSGGFGNEFGQGGGQGNTRGGGNMASAVDGMGGSGGGNMEIPNGGGGGNRGVNDRGNRFNRPNFNTQQNMGRFNMGGGGGGGGVGSSNNNMGGSNTMMSMMLCQETPSRFRELPCNLNNPQSCPMSQYLTCQSGVYFYPVCCAKDWRSLRIVDVMF